MLDHWPFRRLWGLLVQHQRLLDRAPELGDIGSEAAQPPNARTRAAEPLDRALHLLLEPVEHGIRLCRERMELVAQRVQPAQVALVGVHLVQPSLQFASVKRAGCWIPGLLIAVMIRQSVRDRQRPRVVGARAEGRRRSAHMGLRAGKQGAGGHNVAVLVGGREREAHVASGIVHVHPWPLRAARKHPAQPVRIQPTVPVVQRALFPPVGQRRGAPGRRRGQPALRRPCGLQKPRSVLCPGGPCDRWVLEACIRVRWYLEF